MMEHPGPPGLLSDPRAGFVRSEDGAGEQPDADQARLPGERLPAVVEHVDQRTFADVEADEVGEQARQPLERDRVGEPQIERKGPRVATQRRTSPHSPPAHPLQPLGPPRAPHYSMSPSRWAVAPCRGSNVPSTPSFPALEQDEESGRGVTHPLTHIRQITASASTPASQFDASANTANPGAEQLPLPDLNESYMHSTK